MKPIPCSAKSMEGIKRSNIINITALIFLIYYSRLYWFEIQIDFKYREYTIKLKTEQNP